jgi:hypothetical protein
MHGGVSSLLHRPLEKIDVPLWCLITPTLMQGINVAHLNMELLGNRTARANGKAIYSLKLECHILGIYALNN